MNDFSKKQYFLDSAGLISIGLFSLGYVLFSRLFAELHIQFSFLNFPIFVGEILLFICLLLFFVKYSTHPQTLTKWHYLIICYFVFVVIKAIYGYLKWGPLALRDSALLYYPAFIIFGRAFYRKQFFDGKRCFLVCLILPIFIVGRFYEYWTLTLAILGFILLKTYPRKIIKFLMLLILFVLIPYDKFYETSRMMIVSNFASGMYLAGIAPVFLVRKKRWRLVLFMLMGGLVTLGLFKFADNNAVKSVIDFKKMAEVFKACDTKAASIDRSAIKEPREVKLYNPDKLIDDHPAEFIFENRVISVQQMKAKIKQVLIDRAKQRIADFSFDKNVVKIPEKHIEEVKKEVELVLLHLEEKIPSEKKSIIAQMRPISDETGENVVEEVKKEAGLVPVQPVKEGMPSEKPVIAQMQPIKDKIPEDTIEETRERIFRTLTEEVNLEMRTAPLERIMKNDKIPAALFSDVRMSLQSSFEADVKQKLPAAISEKPFEKKWIENNNAIFRLFIWRDMLAEFAWEKPILGFDFGRPLRSKTLEALQWGYGDYIRDGWIGAHNSFLHIIYRTGIVGILLILSLVIMLFRMIRQFILVKSFTGILLCGIIINWFVAANFLLIFELPYTAIPIWTIYGMTLAYYRQIRESQVGIRSNQSNFIR